MVHPGEDYLPYTELSSARPLVAFSDIHGHAGPLAHHIECLSHAFHEPLILFVGDAIDYWFPPDLTGKSDWCGERAVSLYGGVLAEAQESLPPLATDDVRAAVRHALDNKPWLGFPVGAVRRAVIGALLSYQALTTLAALPRSAFLLGNHEIDLLSGAWYYRSLQKSFLLNLCGVTGTWCLEYRDYLRANSPITHGHEMSEVRARLLSCSEEVARRMLASYDPMLLWLYSRGVAGNPPFSVTAGVGDDNGSPSRGMVPRFRTPKWGPGSSWWSSWWSRSDSKAEAPSSTGPRGQRAWSRSGHLGSRYLEPGPPVWDTSRYR